jgi:hypothetical protein
MLVGYLNHKNNKQALLKYGCSELVNTLEGIKEGDTLVIDSFHDLAENSKDLTEKLIGIFNKKVGLISIDGTILVERDEAKLLGNFLITLENFRKSLLKEKTKIGLQKARDRGKRGGRPPSISLEKALEVYSHITEGKYNYSELAIMYGTSRSSVHRISNGWFPSNPDKPTPLESASSEVFKTKERVIRVPRKDIIKYQICNKEKKYASNSI